MLSDFVQVEGLAVVHIVSMCLIQEPRCATFLGAAEHQQILAEHLSGGAPFWLTAESATTGVEADFAFAPADAVEQPHITEVLAQQLAEQHIPLSLPFASVSPDCQVTSTRSTKPSTKQFLLDRYLASVEHNTPAVLEDTHTLPGNAGLLNQPPNRFMDASEQLRFADPVEASHSQTSLAFKSEHQTVPATALTEAQLPAIPIFLQQSCNWHSDLANTIRSGCSTTCDYHCQAAEALVLTSSKGQTWKGLALRQACMGRDAIQRDSEAAVQDAAGGGGLLHGGAEDGGEGGGPSRSGSFCCRAKIAWGCATSYSCCVQIPCQQRCCIASALMQA